MEEVISYGVPGFKLDGRLLVWIGAGANHCSFYPGALPIARHASELTRYETSKGTIRFAPSDRLPSSLVATLVQTRVAENAARKAATKKRKLGTTAAPKAKAKRASSKRASSKRASAKRENTKRATTKRATTKRGARKRSGTKRR